MTDYTKLVAALWNNDWSDACPCCDEAMCKDADCIIFQAAAAIEALQAEVKRLEPKRGEWIEADGLYKCSVCGELECCRGKYCPDCGARIEVQE